ncbi:MAG: hypothetical protein LBB75_08925 [Oscillospiraceae bacterium]|jgi:hypothetical protein|nr:hypothetical protein [Oscillospiraceae bacterium]
MNGFSPDAYLAAVREAGYAAPFAGAGAPGQAREAAARVRQSLRELLALDTLPGRVETLSPVALRTTRRRGYTQAKLSLEICEGWRMPAYLLTPDRPNGAGVVALCGHGYGARQILRLDRRGRRRAVNFLDNYQKNFAVELALRGCTVAVPEPVAFGEARLRRDRRKPFYGSSCAAVTGALHLCGRSTAALRACQAMRCLDLLAMQPCIDPARLGCMGISGGGLVSLLTACADERVARAVVSGYVCALRESVLARWHCPDNYIHGLLAVGEPQDLAAAIAPRGLCIESGRRDRLFPVAGAREAHAEIRRVYELMGAGDRLVIDEFDGKHQVSGAKSFDFFG